MGHSSIRLGTFKEWILLQYVHHVCACLMCRVMFDCIMVSEQNLHGIYIYNLHFSSFFLFFNKMSWRAAPTRLWSFSSGKEAINRSCRHASHVRHPSCSFSISGKVGCFLCSAHRWRLLDHLRRLSQQLWQLNQPLSAEIRLLILSQFLLLLWWCLLLLQRYLHSVQHCINDPKIQGLLD